MIDAGAGRSRRANTRHAYRHSRMCLLPRRPAPIFMLIPKCLIHFMFYYLCGDRDIRISRRAAELAADAMRHPRRI